MKTKTNHNRNGIVLLMVLGMLALFSLIIASYVVFTGRSNVAAEAINQGVSREIDRGVIIDEAVGQILYGPGIPSDATNPGARPTPLWGGSILDDYWGRDFIKTNVSAATINFPAGTIAVPPQAPTTLLATQLLRFSVEIPGGPNPPDMDFPAALAGRIITFTDPDCGLNNLSFRILESNPNTLAGRTVVDVLIDLTPHLSTEIEVDGFSGTLRDFFGLNGTVNVTQIDSQRFRQVRQLVYRGGNTTSGASVLINGRPQNGYGYGWASDGTNYNSNGSTTFGQFRLSSALAFNYWSWVPGGTARSLPNGDADEAIDVPDYRDPWLAYFPTASGMGSPAPSFVRPGLLHYIVNLPQSEFEPPSPSPTFDANREQANSLLQMLRAVSPRPIPVVGGRYERFTGGNPSFATAIDQGAASNVYLNQVRAMYISLRDGEWDVDTDGDGRVDAIWIDAGLPHVSMADGTEAIPMVAVRIESLDGRIDINASGNVALSSAQGFTSDVTGPYTGATTGTFSDVFAGFGYGPADLSLRSIFQNTHNGFLARRHSFDAVPGKAGNEPINAFRFQGRTELHDFVRMGGGAATGTRSEFGFPLDVYGRSKIALDAFGNPVMNVELRRTADGRNANEHTDDPYENRMAAVSIDRSSSLAEQEPLLRYRDSDRQQLPHELVSIVEREAAAQSVNVDAIRNSITAYSSTRNHVGNIPPAHLADSLDRNDAVVLLAKMLPGTKAEKIARLQTILPIEMRRGEKFNLNRALGDGVDSEDFNSDGVPDGDGIVDDPEELGRAQERTPNGLLPNVNIDYTPPGEPGGNPRQAYAKNLYCLAMLVAAPRQNGFDFRADTGNGNEQRARAMRLAQWAVNVVDFRDRDAINTRFQYDENPFDGWSLAAESPVVWGVESPEMQLTESIAFHNRAERDTDKDDGSDGAEGPRKETTETDPMDRDADFDQHHVPQGFSAIELFCTRSPAIGQDGANFVSVGQAPPPELYSVTGGRAYLDLGRMSPDNTNPVWRMTVMQNRAGGNSPQALLNGMNEEIYDRVSFRPEQNFNRFNNDGDDPGQVQNSIGGAGLYDRVIWFSKNAPANPGLLPADTNQNRIYYNRSTGNPLVETGTYAVVGSRARTYVGSRRMTTGDPEPAFADQHSPQSIELDNTSFEVNINGNNQLRDQSVANAGDLPCPDCVRTIRGMVVAADPVGATGWTAAMAQNLDNSPGIGFTVSEPLPGNYNLYNPPSVALRSNDAAAPNGYPINSWYDYDTATGALPDVPFDREAGAPIENINDERTVQNFATVYLQRLADPTLPYDDTLNPYLTVDWIPVDLTVFNGEDNQQNPAGFRFAGRDKNGLGTRPDGNDRHTSGQHVLHSYTTQGPAATSRIASLSDDYFGHGAGIRSDANPGSLLTMGALNRQFGTPLTNLPASTHRYIGAPSNPTFPWLPVFNRDFASPYEVMMVTAASTDRVNLEFSLPNPTEDPYAKRTAGNDPVENDFDHLLNFLSSSETATDFEDAPDLYQLFNFVGLPNPYDESQHLYNPAFVNVMGGIDAWPGTRQDSLFPAHELPFSYASDGRWYGRPNINTIASNRVWRELMNSHSRSGETNGAFFSNWIRSRRGYQTNATNGLHSQYPTQFAGAFDGGSSGWIGPRLYDDYNSTDAAYRDRLRRPGTQSTVLRKMPQDGGPTDPHRSLFTRLRSNATDGRARDPGRDAFFRYQTTMRTGNLVSTNSQAYAIWLTVGYFEIDQNGGIGEEYGFAQGSNKRDRAFLVIDRSIPAGFEPGVPHNSSNVILLKRILN